MIVLIKKNALNYSLLCIFKPFTDTSLYISSFTTHRSLKLTNFSEWCWESQLNDNDTDGDGGAFEADMTVVTGDVEEALNP